MNKKTFILILTPVILIASVSLAFAHKVTVFAYTEGDSVFSTSYFSDGRKCRNSKIEVFDRNGKKLLEGKTNKKGEFFFRRPVRTGLKLVLLAEMGHKAEFSLEGKKGAMEKPPAKNKKKANPVYKNNKTKENTTAQFIQKEAMADLIDSLLDVKLKPINMMLLRSQEQGVSSTEVVGGIGYIFGIMGLILYFKTRKG